MTELGFRRSPDGIFANSEGYTQRLLEVLPLCSWKALSQGSLWEVWENLFARLAWICETTRLKSLHGRTCRSSRYLGIKLRARIFTEQANGCFVKRGGGTVGGLQPLTIANSWWRLSFRKIIITILQGEITSIFKLSYATYLPDACADGVTDAQLFVFLTWIMEEGLDYEILTIFEFGFAVHDVRLNFTVCLCEISRLVLGATLSKSLCERMKGVVTRMFDRSGLSLKVAYIC